jgi:iron complex transport system permease protein
MRPVHPSVYSYVLKLLAGVAALAAMFAISMLVGAADVRVDEAWKAIFTRDDSANVTMLRELRLPREIAAMLVGAALSVGGAIMQGLTRNPLAEPGLLGLTAGASAALSIMAALFPAAGYLGITAACFVGAAIGSLLVIGLGTLRRGGLSPLRLVLAGAAISAFLFAFADGLGLAFKVSKNITQWTAGGLIGTSWEQVRTIAPIVVVGLTVAILFSRHLTILSLNEEVATGLGLGTGLVKTVLHLLVILLAGASVALVGQIAFIGLMVPHLVRAMFGPDYRSIIPISAIWGATLMLLADTLARTISAPYEVPVIAIVAMMGLPFFLFVVRKGVGSH